MVTRRRLPSTAAPAANHRVSTLVSRRRRVPATPEPNAPHETSEVVPTPGGGELLFTELISGVRSDARPHRDGEYLHVSSLLYECQRKVTLLDRLKLPRRAQMLSLMDTLTYAQGEAIHDVLKAKAARAAPDKVWGKWSCLCKHHRIDTPITFDKVDQSVLCERCGTPADRYVEVSMFNDDLKVVGNPDLLLYLPALDAFHVNELKSLAHKQWEEIVRPKPEHVLQVVFYWYLMRAAGYRMTDTATIVYATKGYTFRGSPMKEFTVNIQSTLSRLDDYIAAARERKAARDGGPLPKRSCINADAPQARQCEVCTACFSASDTAAQEVSFTSLFARPADSTPRRTPPARTRR